MAEGRHLHSVDADTGEVLDSCPTCSEWQRKYQGVLLQLANLRRDKAKEAKANELWGIAVALWWEWKIATDRPKCKWSAERFWLCEPYLREDGFNVCRFAVWGIAAHPNRKQITATYWEVFNDWELCFRNRATFERYANRGAALFGRDLPVDAVSDTCDTSSDDSL